MEVALAQEKIWFDKYKYEEAEKTYFEQLSKASNNSSLKQSLAEEVAKAREHIRNSLECVDGIAKLTSDNTTVDLNNRLNSLESENSKLRKDVKDLTDIVKKLSDRLAVLEKSKGVTPAKPSNQPANKSTVEDDDDGVDLFGSDSEEEDQEAKKIKEQRLAEYAAKKSKKPVLIAKSNIILDVKPYGDDTDMKKLEQEVRKVSTDGLIWGASKLVPLAYGIHKLQISCVVEDDKVSVDWLQETIQEIDEYVQSVDIAAFNKV